MITHIRGSLISKNPTHLVVETGGIGFFIQIPLSSYNVFGTIGDEVKVLCYLHAREDSLQLFGFATEPEREIFQLLISVSGVGPKLAQGVLSSLSVSDFQSALQNHDLVTLTSAPGVGRKTAERLILELKDKIGDVESRPESSTQDHVSSAREESIRALVSLGYNQLKARQIVQNVIRETEVKTVEDILRQSLKRM